MHMFEVYQAACTCSPGHSLDPKLPVQPRCDGLKHVEQSAAFHHFKRTHAINFICGQFEEDHMFPVDSRARGKLPESGSGLATSRLVLRLYVETEYATPADYIARCLGLIHPRVEHVGSANEAIDRCTDGPFSRAFVRMMLHHGRHRASLTARLTGRVAIWPDTRFKFGSTDYPANTILAYPDLYHRYLAEEIRQQDARLEELRRKREKSMEDLMEAREGLAMTLSDYEAQYQRPLKRAKPNDPW